MKTETLTLKEAIEQGYKYCLFDKEGWQSLIDISDVGEKELERGIVLCEKEPYQPAGMDAKSILEQIAEQIYCQHCDDTGDDTNDVYDRIMDIDLSALEPLVKVIDEKLSTMKTFYRTSGIRLSK